MVVNGRPFKRAKRRVTADLFDFLTFPPPGGDAIFEGPFRSNMRSFLARHARIPPVPPPASPILAAPTSAASPNLATWRVAFRVGDCGGGGEEAARVVELDVVEEDVPRSRSVYCDQCRVVGWSGHPVCGKRYHFIIRNDGIPFSGYNQICTRCGSVLHMLDSRCLSCKHEITAEEFEDWAYLQLDNSTHLLHGVVHANGYGHLLRVNGREGGSKYLTGSDIMAFWDRLCRLLHVRKVTVMDISKKYGMEYRLLHAVTAGHPWYGNWGYEFGAGSFALTAESYKKAVETLSDTPLSIFFSHARSPPRTSLQNTIALYRSLSDRPLETVRDLFCYVTYLLHDIHEAQPRIIAKKCTEVATPGVLCAWKKDDTDMVEEALVKVLRAVGGIQWVTWHALRGAVCQAAAPPEMLDYCLKGLGGKVVDDGFIVATRCNAETSAIEFRIEATSNQQSSTQYLCRPSASHILRDLKILYDALLNPTTMHPYRPRRMQKSACISAAKLLDCKQFIKHYDRQAYGPLSPNPFTLQILCHVELVDQPKDFTAPPPELLVLPPTATVADLKLQATKAFQETYLIFQRFQAEQLLEYGDASDSTHVKALLGSKQVVKVRGRCLGDESKLGRFRMERGTENWVVDCACGAKDDDGERMMACDTCGVWQHTRCAGISDFEKVPVKFLCKKCLCLKRKGSGGRKNKDNPPNGRCKDVMASPSVAKVGSYSSVTIVG